MRSRCATFSRHAAGSLCGLPGSPSTSCNKDSRRCPRAAKAPRSNARRAGRRLRCGSSLQSSTACRSLGECPLQVARTTSPTARISHSHFSMATISQKSSFPRDVKSVSQALMPDIRAKRSDQAARLPPGRMELCGSRHRAPSLVGRPAK